MRAWLCELAIVQGLKTLRINKVIPFGRELIHIEFMTDEELHAVRDVTIMSKKAIERPFRTLTEEEYFARVDKGLSELDAGPGEDLMQLMLKLLPNLGLQCSIG